MKDTPGKVVTVNGKLSEILPVEHQVNRLGEMDYLDLIHGSNIIVLLFMGHLISHVEKPDSNSRKAVMN